MTPRAIAAVGSIAGAIAFYAACGDARSHPYTGRLFHADRGCLDSTSTIDVVDGASSATCDPKCVVSPPGEAGARAVYVSSMCAPYPPFFDTTGNLPGCGEALAAYARNDTCTGDAGSTNPAPKDAAAAE